MTRPQPLPRAVRLPVPAEALIRALADATAGRPGWRPPWMFSPYTAVVEYSPVIGPPGGVISGCGAGWWWSVFDPAGGPVAVTFVAGPLGGAADAAAAVEAVEVAVAMTRGAQGAEGNDQAPVGDSFRAPSPVEHFTSPTDQP